MTGGSLRCPRQQIDNLVQGSAMFRILLALVACTSFCLHEIASAQEAERSTIRVGGSLTSAVEVLRKHHIEFYHSAYYPREVYIPHVDHDLAYVEFVVDKHRTSIDLSYSKSRQTITRMTVVTIPQQ